MPPRRILSRSPGGSRIRGGSRILRGLTVSECFFKKFLIRFPEPFRTDLFRILQIPFFFPDPINLPFLLFCLLKLVQRLQSDAAPAHSADLADAQKLPAF